MGIHRKTSAQDIVTALEATTSFQEVEAVARQCTPAQLFETVIPWTFRNRSEVVELLGDEAGVAHIEVSGCNVDGGWWTFRFGNGKIETASGKQGVADVGVHLDILTWEDLQKRENDPPRAYAQGRIKFTGNPAIGIRTLGRLRKFL